MNYQSSGLEVEQRPHDNGARGAAINRSRVSEAPAYAGGPGGLLETAGAMPDVGNLLRILRRRLWVLIGVIVLVTGGVAYWSFSQVPQYTAEAHVLFGGREERVVNLEAVLSGLPRGAIETERQIIASRELGQRVVAKLGLDEDPEFNPRLVEAHPSLLERLSPVPVVRAYARSLVIEPLGLVAPEPAHTAPAPALTPAEREERLMRSVVGRYLARLATAPVGSSNVLAISFTSENPQKAARIANAVAELYLVSQLEAKFDATRRASAWLEDRLAGLREEVRAAESAVAAYRAEHGLIDAGGLTALEGQVQDLNTRLVLLRAERSEKEARLARARRLANAGGNLETLADVAGFDVISSLRQQRIGLERRAAELSSRYRDPHPEMVNLRAEQRDVQRAMDAEIARALVVLENDAVLAASRERAVGGARDQLQRELNEQHASLVQLRELERHASATRTLFESFLDRFKETEQQQDFAQPDVHMLSQAVPPGGPNWPNHRVNIMAGLVIATLLGLAAAFLVEKLMNSGMHTTQDVERQLGTPMLGAVPLITRAALRGGLRLEDLVVEKPLGAFAEAVRGLRTAVVMSDDDEPPRVVLVTSGLPSEGKTTVSVCLARSSARAGKRTLLIDCDLRRPSVHRVLDHARPEAGLVELLTEKATLNAAIATDAATGLDYILVAGGTPNPSDLLGSWAMRNLLKRLAESYDLVVLDSPPTMAVSDSRVLATVADTTLFLVRWDKTESRAAALGLRALRELGGRVAGAALNGVDMRRQSKYGYGDYAYYYDRYRYYYAK